MPGKIWCAAVLEMAENFQPTRLPILPMGQTSRWTPKRMSIISRRQKAAVRIPIIGSPDPSIFERAQYMRTLSTHPGADA
jgi:hypothetical protein